MASRASTLAILLTSAPLVPACGDDGSQTTADTTSTSDATTTDATSTTDTTSTTGPTTGTSEQTTTGDPPTTSLTTTEATTSTSTTDPETSTTTDGTTGDDLDCMTIEPGPFTPELIGEGYDGSEDLGFDGKGGLALKRGDTVVIVTAEMLETDLAGGFPQVYGTRFATTGELLVALPQSGDLQGITTDGMVGDLAGGLQSPNGLYVDPAGRVWLTEFGGSRVVRFDAQFNKSTVYEGPMASSANGVVLDEARNLLFFTNYGAGRVLKLEVDDLGEPVGEPSEVLTVPGARLDGLALDQCGNIYAVDQGDSRLFRGLLDAEAQLVGQPELLAEFASNVANAQFGWGVGWDPESLYLSGNPGDLYRLPVGIAGAPIGLP
ncbi:Sugar lactone lactonase YvrE [Nannocystis exedens]|uniref:Sugar lactone lactonase YvrE n=1 Tax=Nannocystis exedens TaxID=54 RepID=A0A1I1X4M8_9BACT|nr:gluconolactonase [Nannocystis exedens]PCC70808.1 Virginiamycin B lyase [Nannocystis exedens]SFE02319.1 Sugar lactone lactonase YvrE [Nannocystis exedens]